MILTRNDSRWLPRGLRNNNPGNIRHSSERWQGEVPEKECTDADFKQFVSMAYGYRALLKLLRNYRKLYGCQTVTDFIARWAPSTENDTGAYVRTVCKEMGVGPAFIPDVDDRETMCDFAAAVSLVENGRKAVRSDVEAGWDLL